MKRLIRVLIIASLLAGFFIMPAYSSTVTRAIPSAKVTVITSGLDFTDGYLLDARSCVNVNDNQYYTLDSAEWVDDMQTLMPGTTPRIRVLLEAIPKEDAHSNYDLVYLFRGTYGTSNVFITKGTLEKAEVKDSGYFLELTIKMNAINGTFDIPQYADWVSPTGQAVWATNNVDSGYHDIICMRGSTTVKKLTGYGGTTYNFFPYMTKEGEYKYKIRTVANPSVGIGKPSEWLESGVQYIGADEVSDGSGQTKDDEVNGGQQSGGTPIINDNAFPNGTGNNATVGWVQQNGYTYFFYPNGEFAKSGWMKFDGKWYMFDDNGRRLTGWQKNKYGKWFYMDPTSGVMRTGWLKDGDKWYFLSTEEGSKEGSMVTGWLTWKNQRYYFNSSGVMVTGWYKVDGNYRYFYPEGSKEGGYGYMAVNTTVGDFKFDENGIWQ